MFCKNDSTLQVFPSDLLHAVNMSLIIYLLFCILTEDIFFFIALWGRDRERQPDRERSINVREKHQLVVVCAPTEDRAGNLGVCRVRNRTGDLLVCGMMLQSTEPYWPGFNICLLQNISLSLFFLSLEWFHIFLIIFSLMFCELYATFWF